MTQSTVTLHEKKSHFDAAKEIVAALEGLAKEHQSLAFKFAMETLGLALPTSTAMAAAPPAGARRNESGAAERGDAHATDIKSFTTAKAPKSDQQFAAVVAYFYQFEAPADQRRDAIDASVMKDAARLVGRAQVANWLATLNNANRSGYLDRAERGAFKLNSVGENLVAITLPGDGKTSTSNGRSPPAKKKVAAKHG